MPRPRRWTTDELARRALLEQGVAVPVNLRHHGNLIAWAKERGLFVRVDRATRVRRADADLGIRGGRSRRSP
jgi:hypothetical protein